MDESAARWGSDPFGRYDFRYWDGSAWTEHVATGSNRSTDPPSAAPLSSGSGLSVPQAASGWYPDPLARNEFRFWNGSLWTDHVSSHGRQGIDPLRTPPPIGERIDRAKSSSSPPQREVVSRKTQKVRKQIHAAELVGTSGAFDPSILNEPVLVINQKGKLIEMRAEFAVHDQHGRQLGAVRGRRMSSRMQVVDMDGRQLIELRREASALSSKTAIAGPNGSKIGRVVPSVSWKELDRLFKLENASNQPIGAVFGEDRHHQSAKKRHRNFNVQNTSGTVVARISKTRAPLAKELLTKGDHYVLSIAGQPSNEVRSLMIAAVLVIDARLHQG